MESTPDAVIWNICECNQIDVSDKFCGHCGRCGGCCIGECRVTQDDTTERPTKRIVDSDDVLDLHELLEGDYVGVETLFGVNPEDP